MTLAEKVEFLNAWSVSLCLNPPWFVTLRIAIDFYWSIQVSDDLRQRCAHNLRLPAEGPDREPAHIRGRLGFLQRLSWHRRSARLDRNAQVRRDIFSFSFHFNMDVPKFLGNIHVVTQ